MPIPFTCLNCGHSMKAPSKFAGKRVRCKQCNEFTPIPELEADDPPPGFNAYAFDDEPVLPKRSARRGDDLLGESPPPQEVLPKRIGMGDYGETTRSKRGDGEAPVCGLPPVQVIWISVGILVVSDAIQLGQSMAGQKLLAVFISTVVVQFVWTFVSTGIMAVAGMVVDIEASSFPRLMSISLAQNAVSAIGQMVVILAGQNNMPVLLVVGLSILVANIMILSRSLGLGCLGLIGFVIVEVVIAFVLLFVLGVILGVLGGALQPK